MLSVSQSLIDVAFVNVFAWTAERLAPLLSDCRDPVRATRQALRRRWQQGLLCCGDFDVAHCSIGEAPLWSSDSEFAPDCDAIAYALEQRFAQGSQRARVYWPGPEFAKRFGSWTGSETYPCPHKVSHDLLIGEAWLNYWQRSPLLATTCWFSERRLQWMARKGRTAGPIPDALIVGGDKPRAVEIGGNYGAVWLRHHVSRFTVAGWGWEIW